MSNELKREKTIFPGKGNEDEALHFWDATGSSLCEKVAAFLLH